MLPHFEFTPSCWGIVASSFLSVICMFAHGKLKAFAIPLIFTSTIIACYLSSYAENKPPDEKVFMRIIDRNVSAVFRINQKAVKTLSWNEIGDSDMTAQLQVVKRESLFALDQQWEFSRFFFQHLDGKSEGLKLMSERILEAEKEIQKFDSTKNPSPEKLLEALRAAESIYSDLSPPLTEP